MYWVNRIGLINIGDNLSSWFAKAGPPVDDIVAVSRIEKHHNFAAVNRNDHSSFCTTSFVYLFIALNDRCN